MNSPGFKLNNNTRQGMLDSFIKNRVPANIIKKKPTRGAIQDPIQRQAMTGNLNSAMGNTLQKYKMNTSNGYDSQIDAQQRLQDAGGELLIGNELNESIEGASQGGDMVSDIIRKYREGGGRVINAKKPMSRPIYSPPTKPVETPKNQLSQTLMRYLQGMFNGGF